MPQKGARQPKDTPIRRETLGGPSDIYRESAESKLSSIQQHPKEGGKEKKSRGRRHEEALGDVGYFWGARRRDPLMKGCEGGGERRKKKKKEAQKNR